MFNNAITITDDHKKISTDYIFCNIKGISSGLISFDSRKRVQQINKLTKLLFVDINRNQDIRFNFLRIENN